MQKKHTPADPYADREAAKYQNPIPSREFILDYLTNAGGPKSRKQIAKALSIDQDEALEALRRRLKAMERDGQVLKNRKGAYGIVKKMDLIRGRVIGHADGFGFLVPDEAGDDLFLSGRQMRCVLHGDIVLARITGVDRKGRKEGAIVEVLERANNTVVGRFSKEGEIGLVLPDNKRIHQEILILPGGENNAKHGQIVIAEITEQPDLHRQPMGRIIEVLGEHMAPGMEIDIAIRTHGIPNKWSDEVEQEIGGFTPEVSDYDKQGRLDLRPYPFVTIDGEDARDFDDAVFCQKNAEGWRLWVAIADVSHYVKIASALDLEAKNRGNSVYFPNAVIPMLPEILSNGLCSLNPQVDRLALVCEMHFSPRGVIKGYRFHKAVIHSAARLTYNIVDAIVNLKDKDYRQQYAHIVPDLDRLFILYQYLHKRRQTRGAIDFDTTESKIIFGVDRKIERVVPLVRNEAHRIIEEFMLAANVASAEYLSESKLPFLYRVHDRPHQEKLDDLRAFLAQLGLTLGGGKKPKVKDYAKLMSNIVERKDSHLIQMVLLRSLRLAVYTHENIGHFGLAFDAYTHFTSPIRRYPDLLVHRAIKHLLDNGKPENYPYDIAQIQSLGTHCSNTERRADDATRDAINWLKCEFMLDKVGEVFDGVISTVTAFGFFVELKDIYVEGLVHVTSLKNDYYHFDPISHRLTGERTGRAYRLSQNVKVKVMRVNLDDKKIDFDVVDG